MPWVEKKGRDRARQKSKEEDVAKRGWEKEKREK